MFRLWGKIMKNNRFQSDLVIEIDRPDWSRKMKTESAMDTLCLALDIQRPMWLPDNEKDYAFFNKTAFRQDHFIETIGFDYFEIEIIEDDKPL